MLKDLKKMLGELSGLQDKLRIEREEISNALTFIYSLKSVINYAETGNPYPDDEVY